jgi:autotransporter translocation and assembly factor TamB
MKFFKHFKTPLRVLVVFLLLILLLYILVTQTNIPERLAVKIFEKTFGNRYNLTLSVGDIGGTLFSNLTIDEVAVQYHAKDTTYQVGYIKKLRAEYSLTNIWRGKWVINRLYADSLDIGLRQDLLDKFKAGPKEEKKSGGVDFDIKELIINHAAMKNYDREKPEMVDSLNFYGSLYRESDTLALKIDSSSLNLAMMNMDVEQLRGLYVLKDTSLYADSAYVKTLGSHLLVMAKVDDIKNLSYSVDIINSHFDLKQLGDLLNAGLEGGMDIKGVVRGNPQRVKGNIALDGNLFGNPLKNINTEFEYYDEKILFTNLQGGAFKSSLKGNGFLDLKSSPNLYTFSGQMSDFNLNNLVANSFNTSFSGSVILDGHGFSESDFEMVIKASLGKGFFDVYNFDSVSGYADVFMDSIVLGKPLTVLMQGATVTAAGTIDYTGQLDVSGHGDFPQLDPLVNILNIQYMNISGRGHTDFRFYGPIIDPHLKAAFNSDSVSAYGLLSDSMTIDLNLDKFALYQQGMMYVRSGSFFLNQYAGDSILADVQFDSNKMLIDTLQLFSPHLDADLAMNLEFEQNLTTIDAPSLLMVVDTFKIRNSDTIKVSVTDSAVTINRLMLESAGGSVNANGKYYYQDGMNFDLAFENFNLKPIADFYLPREQLRGIFGLNAHLSGTPENPQFTIEGFTDSLQMYGYNYGNLDFKFSYRDSALNIDSFYLQGDSNLTRITGVIPYDLAFANVPSRLIPNREIDLEVGSRGTSFFILPVVLPDIEWMEGDNVIDMKVTGTPDNPIFSGHYYLRGGTIKVYYLENVLENVLVDITFKNHDIVIDKMSTTTKTGGKKGTATATGKLTFENLFKPTVDIDATATNFPVKYDLGDVEAVIGKANIHIGGTDTLTATGSVTLTSFLYGESFEPTIAPGALEAADTVSTFNYVIDISAPSNIKVVNPNFNVELGGDLRVFKEGNFQNFYGRLETIRGKYNFLDQSFTILPGGEIIFDDIAEFNPRLNIEVQTYINSQGERLTALLLLSGTLQEPKLTAAEGSEVSENQFLEWLTFQRFSNPAGDTGTTSFDQRLSYGVTEVALGRLTSYLGRRIGLETLEFNPVYGSEGVNLEESELRVGLYTTPGLYIYGTAQLDFRRAHEVGFEYRFSRRFFLSGFRDQYNLYHLNLNLNWNF